MDVRMPVRRNASLPYRIGGLLYAPATRRGIADQLAHDAIPCLSALAFCLEDSIRDAALPEAEETLLQTLKEIGRHDIRRLPLLFVRVRSPEHLRHMHALLGETSQLLTGYIFPKFDCSNAESYARQMQAINAVGKFYYAMPILESPAVARLAGRVQTLMSLKEIIDGMGDCVLNVRVGGNDFCGLYGIRRPVNSSIYDIGVVRDILSDILNVFSPDHVVSGPVWEYFGSEADGAWARGLRRELELDALNGFVGKTAIHPSQLPIIYDSLRVSPTDLADAEHILSWQDDTLAVDRGSGSRMNEVKCHRSWAEKIRMRAGIYGVRGDPLPTGGVQ